MMGAKNVKTNNKNDGGQNVKTNNKNDGAKMLKQTIRMRGPNVKTSNKNEGGQYHRQHVMVMSAIWVRLQHAYKRKQMMDNM